MEIEFARIAEVAVGTFVGGIGIASLIWGLSTVRRAEGWPGFLEVGAVLIPLIWIMLVLSAAS